MGAVLEHNGNFLAVDEGVIVAHYEGRIHLTHRLHLLHRFQPNSLRYLRNINLLYYVKFIFNQLSSLNFLSHITPSCQRNFDLMLLNFEQTFPLTRCRFNAIGFGLIYTHPPTALMIYKLSYQPSHPYPLNHTATPTPYLLQSWQRVLSAF